jgi:hypothetical protein
LIRRRIMSRRNWDKVARKEFEAMDPEERESFLELRAKIYGE